MFECVCVLQEATKTSGLNIILEMNGGLNLQLDLELISLRGRIAVSTSTLFIFSLHTLCCRGSVCTQTSSYCKMGGQGDSGKDRAMLWVRQGGGLPFDLHFWRRFNTYMIALWPDTVMQIMPTYTYCKHSDMVAEKLIDLLDRPQGHLI